MSRRELSERDEIEIGRYLDGELGPEQAAALEARAAASPALRQLVGEARALGGWFRTARQEAPPAPRAGFAQRVMQRLDGAMAADTVAAGARDERQRIIAFSRLCLWLAAAVLVLASLVASGLLRRPDSQRLRADGGAGYEALIRQLDLEIQAEEGRHAAAENR